IIQIDLDPSEIGKIYPAHLGIVGGAREVLRALIARLRAMNVTPRSTRERVERIRTEKAAWQAELARRGSGSDGDVTQWHLYQALKEVVGPETTLVVEGGTGEFIRRFFATSSVYTGGDFRPIGHGLSSSVGLSYANPGRNVMCISGDGSFMMEMQELATAMRANLPLTCVVV